MKKYYIDKNNNDSNNMKILLSNYYSLVNNNNNNNVNIRHYNRINNVILPRFGDRNILPFITTYNKDYNRPKCCKHLSRMNRL